MAGRGVEALKAKAGSGLQPAPHAARVPGPAEVGPAELGQEELGPEELGPVELGPEELGPAVHR